MSYINKERFEERLNASPLFDNFGEDGAFIRDFVIQLMGEMVEKESPCERLTKFNEETSLYEYNGVAKTREEFIAQRKAAIQKLGAYEDWWLAQRPFVDCTKCPKAPDVAEEIFAEIEREIKNHGICYAQRKIAELKKKYIGKDTNVTTKTEGEK